MDALISSPLTLSKDTYSWLCLCSFREGDLSFSRKYYCLPQRGVKTLVFKAIIYSLSFFFFQKSCKISLIVWWFPLKRDHDLVSLGMRVQQMRGQCERSLQNSKWGHIRNTSGLGRRAPAVVEYYLLLV